MKFRERIDNFAEAYRDSFPLNVVLAILDKMNLYRVGDLSGTPSSNTDVVGDEIAPIESLSLRDRK